MEFNPFITYYRDNTDYNYLDTLSEIDSVIARNDAIQSFLDGQVDCEYLLDFLESKDIDPEAYMESVIDQIEYMMSCV